MTYLLLYLALLWSTFTLSVGKSSRFVYSIWLIIIFTFVAFRYQVGCDWDGYENIFELQRYSSLTDALNQTEPLFWVVNAVIHWMGLKYPYVNIFAAACFFLGFNAFVVRQPDPMGVLTLAFPILILNLVMSGIRQAIALGFLCLAFNAFTDKRPIRFVAIVIFASCFHFSAIAFLIFTPFVYGFTTRRAFFTILVLLPLGYHYVLGIEAVAEYSRRYVGSDAKEASGAVFRAALLAATGVAFFFFLRKRWRSHFNLDYTLVWLCSCMMIATLPISLVSSVMGDRFGYYLIPIQLVIFTRLRWVTKGPPILRPIVRLLPYIAGLVFLAVWTETSTLFALCYLPYRTWLWAF